MASVQSTPTPTLSNSEQPRADPLINNDANIDRRKQPVKRSTTAERRATHNAVERARRETLNGRFLLLASLLPNLQQIRRPSKSAIVNSSIAHVNASRRHRLLASRVTQDLLRETDELRRELNEWRERAGVRKLEPRMRTEGFGMVIRGELEPISISPGDDEEDDDYHFQEQMNMIPGRLPQIPYTHPMSRPVMQRHASYGPGIQPPMVVIPSAQVHFDPTHPANTHGVGYAPSHQQVVSAPHTALPSPPSAPPLHPTPHASTVGVFSHPAEPQFLSTETEKTLGAGYGASQQRRMSQLVAHWSDDSSSASSASMEQPHSAPGSGYSSPPHSPFSFEHSRMSVDLGSYEYDGAYDLVPPSSSSGSSDGFMSAVPRALNGQALLSNPCAATEQFGLLNVV